MGRLPGSFWNQKKYPDFEKKGPACVHLWVKFFIQNIVLRVSRRTNSKMFPCWPLFLVFLTERLSKCPSSTTPRPTCPEKLLSVCVCVCVCVCMCVCISFQRKGFSWLTQNNKCNARDQASDIVLRKLFCVKYLRRHVLNNDSRDLQASNCARVSIKPGRAKRSKKQLLELSENQR